MNNKALLEKIEFFRLNNIKCHVITIPKGTFKNGKFTSGLDENNFFWFVCDDGIPFRLFLSEIFDVVEYKDREVDYK